MTDLGDFIWQVIISMGASGLLAAALIWLTKSTIAERLKNAIKSEYDLHLETFKDALKAESDSKLAVLKSELKSKSDVELERLRSGLSIIATEHQIHLTGLYERRADSVQSIYALLNELHEKLSTYVQPFQFAGEPSKEEKRREAVESFLAFSRGYKPLLICVPKETASRLRSIEVQCRTAYNKFATIVQDQQTQYAQDTWLAVHRAVEGDITAALMELEEEFRSLLAGPRIGADGRGE